MFNITLITMGKLKEKFYLTAAAEYEKRLKGYCQFRILELPEVRLPEDPSPAEKQKALSTEAAAIREKLPKGGAVVAIDIKTGKILVCASYPTYDLSTLFDNYKELLNADLQPMFNRALQATYAPGSTYKMATIITAMETGKLQPYTIIYDKTGTVYSSGAGLQIIEE